MTKKLNPKTVQQEFDNRALNRGGINKVLSSRFPETVNQEFDDKVHKLLREYLDSEFRNVLDVGVGIGRTANFFLPRTESFVGVDFSEKMLADAAETIGENKNVVLKHADVLDLNYENDHFDLGVVSLVLKHNSDERAEQIINQLKKSCKKVLLIEHVAGGSKGSDIAIVRSADWYIKKFLPMSPNFSMQFKRNKDNILFTILS